MAAGLTTTTEVTPEDGGGSPHHVLAALALVNQRGAAELGGLLADGALRRGSEGRLLDHLPDEGIRPSDLAVQVGITKQAVGQRLRDLEARGLVVLDPDPADARAVLARRTEHGEQVRRQIQRGIAEVEAAWEAEVGAERYAAFRAVLDELAGIT